MQLSKAVKKELEQYNIFPKYDVNKKNNCILHFGVGNFHRAHQALYIHELIEQNNDISIIGINLRSNKTKEKLEKQDYLYSLVEISDEQQNITIINSIKEILFGLTEKEKIRNLISSPEIKLITLTVTEKGYYFDKNKNLLNSKEIVNDFKDDKLFTVIGHLSFGLIERYKKNKENITIISCDNLSENGSILKNLVTQFIKKINPESLDWVEKNVNFPLTMVDGIVPNNKISSESFKLPYYDSSLVVTEPYRKWYIQSGDQYLQSILKNDKINFVDDVKFYENIKLKILNASHSALAYIGHLLGYTYVHEAINDKICYKFISNFLDKEVIPTIDTKKNFNINEFKNIVLKRFKNTFIEDRLLRIAIDGSYKIPIRIIETFKNNKKNTDHIDLIITAWLIFIEERLSISHLELNDPNNELFMQLYNEDKNTYIEKILELKNIFNITNEQKTKLLKNILNNVEYIKAHSLKELIRQI